MTKPPFIIFGLPRSRTFWLSRFLSYGGWHCGHDELRHMRTMDDVAAWFRQPNTGTVETAGAPWWRLVREICPESSVVTVRRPVDEVVDSLARLGLTFDRGAVTKSIGQLDRKLDQIEARIPNVLSVRFRDLDEGNCREVFEHCLPFAHDPAWWAHMDSLNIQIDFHAMLRYMAAYQAAMSKLAAIAKHRAIASMSRKTVADIDGVTIQQESFETFYQQGQHLFAEHLIQVGEAPYAFAEKNVPLMRVLDQIGAIQVTTARSNGRMFGYLMAVISPSLESQTTISAIHTTFYAEKSMHGLGLKLQRASVQALADRGVHEVWFRAGARGNGPRMGPMYRRLGAEITGELYRLDLKKAA